MVYSVCSQPSLRLACSCTCAESKAARTLFGRQNSVGSIQSGTDDAPKQAQPRKGARRRTGTLRHHVRWYRAVSHQIRPDDCSGFEPESVELCSLTTFKPYLWDFPNIFATICCSIACSRVRCKRCGEKSTAEGAGNSLAGDVYLLIGLFEGASWEHPRRVFPSNKVSATSGANTLVRLYPLFLISKATGATTPQGCSY